MTAASLAEFDAIKARHREPARVALEILDAGDDGGSIPPRGWLLGNSFCRRYLSSLTAGGGTGKTTLRIAQALSLASGRSLTGEYVFQQCRVLYVSLEDDIDDLRRRVRAAMLHHGIDREDIRGRFVLSAPTGLRLAEMKDGRVETGPLEGELRTVIEREQFDLVIVDPFLKSHGVPENDNAAIDSVAIMLTRIAIDLNCAIDSPHHVSKGAMVAGDADKGRGASSFRDAARLVYTLSTMTPEEAMTFGIAEGVRRSYVRMDSAKVNIARHAAEAKWFRHVGVRLNNGSPDYPHGDEVQTVERWQPPDTWGGLSSVDLNAALTEIAAGMEGGKLYSGAPNAKARAAWPVVLKHCPTKSEKQCREIIATWLKNGVLLAAEYHDSKRGEQVEGLKVNDARRPS